MYFIIPYASLNTVTILSVLDLNETMGFYANL